ncbi:hypothetical protein NOF55_08165 [Rhizobiaceae bacterium BDR2-2]|uniref:Uncharacterized protein n=1 Tax=Ectorhizobium quercum TaxID=2965071 RepID=A0AAE3MZQ9_9HYPH|nr:hypothetical protein [Ectorhizobium quercum]MCX8997079.1 hypothetical protein [Ectorhizobium quercum]
MAVQSAQVIDLQAYRNAKIQHADVQATPAVYQPVLMWMPVWAFVPMTMGPWNYGR